jgi:hypothetical protein
LAAAWAHQSRPLAVDVEEEVPLGLVDLEEGGDLDDAGVVHQDVDAAEAADGGVDDGLDLLLAADVEGEAEGLPAGRLDLGGDGLGGVVLEVGDDDAGALLREAEGGGAADALGAAVTIAVFPSSLVMGAVSSVELDGWGLPSPPTPLPIMGEGGTTCWAL